MAEEQEMQGIAQQTGVFGLRRAQAAGEALRPPSGEEEGFADRQTGRAEMPLARRATEFADRQTGRAEMPLARRATEAEKDAAQSGSYVPDPFVIDGVVDGAGNEVLFEKNEVVADLDQLDAEGKLVFARMNAEQQHALLGGLYYWVQGLRGVLGDKLAAVWVDETDEEKAASKAITRLLDYLARKRGGFAGPDYGFIGSPTKEQILPRLTDAIAAEIPQLPIVQPRTEDSGTRAIVESLVDAMSAPPGSNTHSLTSNNLQRLSYLVLALSGGQELLREEQDEFVKLCPGGVPSSLKDDNGGALVESAGGLNMLVSTMQEALSAENRAVQPKKAMLLKLLARRLDTKSTEALLQQLLPANLDEQGLFLSWRPFAKDNNTTDIHGLITAFEQITAMLPKYFNGVTGLLKKAAAVVTNGDGRICAAGEIRRVARSIHRHLEKLTVDGYTGNLNLHGPLEQQQQDALVRAASLETRAAVSAALEARDSKRSSSQQDNVDMQRRLAQLETLVKTGDRQQHKRQRTDGQADNRQQQGSSYGHQGNLYNRPQQGRYSDNRQDQGDINNTCLRCFQRGHRSGSCQAPFADMSRVPPSLPSGLVRVAENLRRPTS